MLSACHSPTRREGWRPLTTVVCFPPPHRTPPAARRTQPCASRSVGYLRDGATSHGGTTSVVTTPRRCVWSRIAPRPSGIPILSSPASTPGLLQRLVSVVWHQSPRENGCSVGRSAGSARRLQPLKPNFTPLMYRLSWLPRSLLFPEFLSFSGLSPLPSCSAAPLYCRRSPPLLKVLYHQWLEPITGYFHMSSVYMLYILGRHR
jgi:hypothetical protein